MSERIKHIVTAKHPRFPRTRCGRTLDLARDRKHGTVEHVENSNCPRCREARAPAHAGQFGGYSA